MAGAFHWDRERLKVGCCTVEQGGRGGCVSVCVYVHTQLSSLGVQVRRACSSPKQCCICTLHVT